MTIDEAIEILKDDIHHRNLSNIEQATKAKQLGIEALRRVKYARNHPSGWELEPLPGETKTD